MSQVNTNVTADKLYEEAFSINMPETIVTKEVFQYHNLIIRECNLLVDLQMGTIFKNYPNSFLGITFQVKYSP